jgi:hypothetical protein
VAFGIWASVMVSFGSAASGRRRIFDPNVGAPVAPNHLDPSRHFDAEGPLQIASHGGRDLNAPPLLALANREDRTRRRPAVAIPPVPQDRAKHLGDLEELRPRRLGAWRPTTFEVAGRVERAPLDRL